MALRIERSFACLVLLSAVSWGAVACGGSDFSTKNDYSTGGATSGGATGTGGGTATGGSASGGASATGGSSSSGGSTGTGGGSSGTACSADAPCQNGTCMGTGCDAEWTCSGPVACTANVTEYCGCDGVTFTASGSCPTKPYSHEGACSNSGETVDCNDEHITCLPIVAPEPCQDGKVYSVKSNCYGECVELSQCKCDVASDCPGDNACYNNSKTCGPWLK